MGEEVRHQPVDAVGLVEEDMIGAGAMTVAMVVDILPVEATVEDIVDVPGGTHRIERLERFKDAHCRYVHLWWGKEKRTGPDGLFQYGN